MSEGYTFVFAPEIEAALVSVAWHEPERLATIYRELDPAVHISQPHLRYLLEAIDLAHRDLGCVNFETVIQVLRETGHLEDCGGLDGANHVYRIEEAGSDLISVEPDVRVVKPGWAERTEKIFRHYLEMLKTYAVHRKMDPPRPVYAFTSGRLMLYPNKAKDAQNSPDALGEGKIGARSYRAAMWIESDVHGQKIFKVSLTPK